MADEPVVIKVSETGTDDVTAKLVKFGQTADEAGKQAAASIASASSAYTAFAAQLAQATQAAQQAASATGQATQAAQAGTAATQGATAALGANAGAAAAAAGATQGAAVANNAAAQSATAHAASVNNLSRSYSALSEAVRIAAVLFGLNMFKEAIDGATNTEFQLKRLTATTGNYNQVFQTLLNTANSTGQTLDSTVRLFQSFTVATQGTTLSQQTLLLAVDSVEKALFLSGTTAEHSSRVLRDLVEAAAQGTLTSRQLVTILAQAPGVMELLTEATGKTTKELLNQSAAHGTVAKSAHALSQVTVTEEAIKTAALEKSLKAATDHDLKVSTSANSTQEQIKKADDRVTASKLAVVDNYQLTSARQQDLDAKNAASAQGSVKALDDLVTKFADNNAQISALVAARTLTIAQSFTVLKNDLEAYMVSANDVDGVNSKISAGILLIAAAIPALIPLVVALGAAWLVTKGYMLLTTVTEGLAAFAVTLATRVIPAVVAFGASALFAFGLIPGLIIAATIALAAFFIPWAKLADLVDQWAAKGKQAFGDAIVGANKTAQALNQTTAAQQALTAATEQYLNVGSGQISSNGTSATTGGSAFGGDGSGAPVGVDQPQQLGSSGGTPVPIVDSGPISDSGFRSGGDFRIPGTGAPDTRLVQFMASPGERIIVQTPAQAASYDKLPHFASGGQLNVNDAVTLGLAGLTTAFVASGTNSLVGYNAPSPTSVTPSASTVPDAATPTAPLSDAASSASSASPSFTTPDTGNTITPGELLSIQRYETDTGHDPFAGTDADRATALRIMGRLSAGHETDTLYFPFGPTPSRGVPVWFGTSQINADGSANHIWVDGGYPLPTSGGFTRSGRDPGLAPVVARARDGLDFTVPGTGAVDSRVLSMAVSPGEQVSVKTPSQQQSEGRSGGKSLVQNITIQTTDADSYGRSSKQIMRDLANKMIGAF